MTSEAHPAATSRPRLGLDDVVGVHHPREHAWSPTEPLLAFLEDRGDDTRLVVTAPGGVPSMIAGPSGQRVASFAWHPSGRSIAFVVDGQVFLAPVAPDGTSNGPHRRVLTLESEVRQLTWSPAGGSLFAVASGDLVRWTEESGSARVPLPGRLGGHEGPLVAVSPDEARLAFSFVDGGYLHLGIVDHGGLTYRTFTATPERQPLWLDAKTLLYLREIDSYRRREYRILRISADGAIEDALAFAEEDDVGLAHPRIAQPSPDGRRVCLVLSLDGWDHLHVLSMRPPFKRQQVTSGGWEDSGHRHETPMWSPNGQYIAFSSNRDLNPGERAVDVVDVKTRALARLSTPNGNSVDPVWSHDGAWIAYVRSTSREPAAMAFTPWPPGNEAEAELTVPRHVPHALVAPGPEPEGVWIGSQDGSKIHGYLLRPPACGSPESVPAVVWLHGGPSRQMRAGWHPKSSYARMYGYHRYLAERGFAVLALNYRGSVGYGRTYEQGAAGKAGVADTADVVAAGRWLAEQPWVNADAVAVWGHSYGGYMVMHALTKYPDVFALGLQAAGIWDMEQWIRFKEKPYFDARGNAKRRIGGEPDLAREAYDIASPNRFVAGLKRRLVGFHGTADTNVDFAQITKMIADCLEHGKEYAAHIYPGEVHQFRKTRTWMHYLHHVEVELDALRRVRAST